jgi:hypothetical protein
MHACGKLLLLSLCTKRKKKQGENKLDMASRCLCMYYSTIRTSACNIRFVRLIIYAYIQIAWTNNCG